MPFISMSSITSKVVPTPGNISNVVVRPRPDGGCQTLVFLENEVQELLPHTHCGGDGEGGPSKAGMTFRLSEQPLQPTVTPGSPPLRTVCRAVYEPTTGAVFYVQGFAVLRLDSDDRISLVAGNEAESGHVDGPGGMARFQYIIALAANGKGDIFIAQNEPGTPIRRLNAASGVVGTVQGSALECEQWLALSYDPFTDTLLVGTARAVCRVSPHGGAPTVVAGHLSQRGRIDGHGTAARFCQIRSVLAAARGTLYLADAGQLRVMDCDANVSTLCAFEAEGEYKRVQQMALLPGGELAVSKRDDAYPPAAADGIHIISLMHGLSFTPCSDVLAGRVPSPQAMPAWLKTITTGCTGPSASLAGGGNGDTAAEHGGESTCVASDSGTVKVVAAAGGGKCVWVHRSALTQRSEYFKRLLLPGTGFGDSGADEVTLPDGADLDTFAWLLRYFYEGTLHLPVDVLRSAAEMAGWLLLPEDVTRQLVSQLMEVVTPGSVLSDLVWAEHYNLTALVPRLKAFLLQHRREVVKATGREQVQDLLAVLMIQRPDLASELMCELLLS